VGVAAVELDGTNAVTTRVLGQIWAAGLEAGAS
jgi:hypothetical protein